MQVCISYFFIFVPIINEEYKGGKTKRVNMWSV